jgi:type II secretory pathway component PulJ
MRCTVPAGVRDRRGFTLLEVLLALGTLSVVVLLLAGTLRVGLRAWEAGQRRAASQQEVRAIVELVTEALAQAYPYRGRLGDGLERVILFQGKATEVRFVTTAPPLALDAPTAPFHAVTLGRTSDDRLRLVERLVPATEPFGDGPEATLSRLVTTFRLEYRDHTGAWQEQWDGQRAAGLPTAVRVALGLRTGSRTIVVPPFVVSIALGKESA